MEHEKRIWRVIESSRLASTGEHSHVCPVSDERIHFKTCFTDCPFLGRVPEHGEVRKKLLPVGYRVRCPVPLDSSVPDYDVSRAVDSDDLPKSRPEFWDDPSWAVAELKRDGVRLRLVFTLDGVRAFTRRRNRRGEFTEVTANLPHLQIAAPQLAGTELSKGTGQRTR